MIAGRMKAREKNDIINAFTDAVDDKQKRKTKSNIQILIGITRYVGVGLHLTRATNVVLMEPDYDFGRELQAYHRIHRIGQQNPLTKSFRLIDADSEIEQRILKRQQDRKEFPGRILSNEEVFNLGVHELVVN
jgi:SNF2 family DNA or RNA helicase